MKIKLLHLNIEKQKHLELVRNFLNVQNPDVACFVEIIESDANRFAKELGYEIVYSPLVSTKSGDTEGTAILSRKPIMKSSDFRYDDDESNKIPKPKQKTNDGNRPKERFCFHCSVLTATLNINGKELTIATTHFPVVDHSTPGREDHSFDEVSNVREINHIRELFERFMGIIRGLPRPLVFTSDLNNPRGEYLYDTLAHELIDLTPKHVDSTLDPNIHRKKNLKLVVDTIMTSPNINAESVKIFEGISDHKSLVAVLKI